VSGHEGGLRVVARVFRRRGRASQGLQNIPKRQPHDRGPGKRAAWEGFSFALPKKSSALLGERRNRQGGRKNRLKKSSARPIFSFALPKLSSARLIFSFALLKK